MRTHDPYGDFAARYDAFPSEGAQREAFFRDLFRRHDVKRLLDCACGTGRDLLSFGALGVDVVGSDLSKAMPERARSRLEAANVEIPLVHADFRELPDRVEGPFDAVVCLSTSLPHLQEEGELVRALGSMREVLRSGGILVLDQGMTDRQWAEKPRFVPEVNTPELSRLMAIDYGETTFTVHVLDFVGEAGQRSFHHDAFTYRRLLGDDYVRLIRGAGFAGVELLGGFDGGVYDRGESRRLIVVAER
jgi:glycine/sarcosine N-methyltransferase